MCIIVGAAEASKICKAVLWIASLNLLELECVSGFRPMMLYALSNICTFIGHQSLQRNCSNKHKPLALDFGSVQMFLLSIHFGSVERLISLLIA